MNQPVYSFRAPSEEEYLLTQQRLREHTEAAIGQPVAHIPFAVLAHAGGALVGSVIGKIYLNWLHLDLVWVDDTHRGKGIGRELMRRAESEARAAGLSGIEVWTQSWQAPEFYLRCGYHLFAELEDFLPGRKRYAFRRLPGAA